MSKSSVFIVLNYGHFYFPNSFKYGFNQRNSFNRLIQKKKKKFYMLSKSEAKVLCITAAST